MSISAIGGNMSLNTINVSMSSAPVQSKPAVNTEETGAVVGDSIDTSGRVEAETPDISAFMRSVSAQSAESVEVQAAPEQSESAESAPTEGLQKPGPEATTDEISAYCVAVAKGDGTVAERTELISEALTQGLSKADTPNPEWTQANPEQIKLYVQETLEHVDAVRQIGELRGLDFGDHDLEPGTGKFEPRVAQYLALPGREESVKWSIAQHNASPHHADWKDPNASKDELAESASDIVNAWRMNRRVYDKPSWSWERIADVINADYANNAINENQRDALLEAIPFQMQWEEQYGLPS